ncbi:MAG: GGDEF domain-containing protein [Treponema sp.]|nr:GGDEF domain-containing protein [Treponema sp.]
MNQKTGRQLVRNFFTTLCIFILFGSIYLFVPKRIKEIDFTILFILLFISSLATYYASLAHKRRIQRIIDFDELTGLMTTKNFIENVEHILKTAKSDEYSIISIDIEKFRYLADALGTDTADAIIKELAKHFKKEAPSDALICRNYTDNFIVLVKATFRPIVEDQVLSLLSVVEKMGNLLPLHYTLDFSIGVYVIMNTNEKVQSMIEKANTARKFGMRSFNPRRVSFYDENMKITTENEKEIIFDMNRAFEENEFIAYYQPKFRFQDAQIIGAEALVRWNHKTKGILPPSAFVPLFERNGFIQKIDLLVFESVCKFLDKWNKSAPEDKTAPAITISCNLSRMQLYNPDVAKEYAEIASKYQIAPSKIEIELTESLMMDNKERLLKAMNEIKKVGFEISVDDFGSGFSSLGLLKDIPANVIKLDKSFLGSESEREHIIIKSVITMAKDLDLKTVAEGIEDKEQAELLKNMGCDIAQGYLYSKPIPEKDFENLLHKALD